MLGLRVSSTSSSAKWLPDRGPDAQEAGPLTPMKLSRILHRQSGPLCAKKPEHLQQLLPTDEPLLNHLVNNGDLINERDASGRRLLPLVLGGTLALLRGWWG